MGTRINELAEKLSEKDLELSNIAVQRDGKVLYQVNDLFMSLEDASNVAQGLMTLGDVQERNAQQTPIGSLTAIAAAMRFVPVAKTLYDVSKDGWQLLKPSPHLQIDIVNVASCQKQYVVIVRIENLSRSGIYLESVALAQRSIPEEDKLSLKQPTLLLSLHPSGAAISDSFSSSPITSALPRNSSLPYYLPPRFNDEQHYPKVFDMELPSSYQGRELRSYAVAELGFSKLDEPEPDKALFTFRLR